MSYKKNKMAFTIVELIIVIAVIGVLAAILIPTFSGVIEKANAKSALSDAKNTLTTYITAATENKSIPDSIVIITKKAGDFYLFGYEQGHGILLQSKNNPYSGYSDVDALITSQNCAAGTSENGKSFTLTQMRSTQFNELSTAIGNAISGTNVYEGTLLNTVAVTISGETSNTGIYFTDMKGRAGYLEKPAEDVIALQAADCEILYAIGAGDLLIGRGAYCDYPTQVTTLPAVDSGTETNVEQIIALSPDVIIMPTMNQTVEQVEMLENAGITVVVTEASSIADTYAAIRLIGKVTGHDTEAEAVIDSMVSTFEAIVDAVPTGEAKKIYFEVSSAAWGNPWTTGNGTFMNEFAQMLNLENIFDDLSGWAEVSSEQIIARNPNYIITTDAWSGGTSEIIARDGYSGITAVTNGDVFLLDANTTSRPGPRLTEALQSLYDCVYGG